MNGILKMQSLQALTEEAENLLYQAKKCVPKLYKNTVTKGKQSYSIYQKLAEIRKEALSSAFSLADPLIEQNHITLSDSRLIEKLVIRERLNALIFNLYPANKGYTLSVIVRNSDSSEKQINSMRLPYTEEELFSYIDNEEIPPLLCHMIDNCIVQLYYNGCVIAEIRDYRKSETLTNYSKHHVLLHQSTQTILNDINETLITDAKIEDKFSAKLELEKTLLLANYGPLCLHPKPSIAIAKQKLHYSKNFLNTRELRYKARKRTLFGIAQKKRLEQYTKCLAPIQSLIEFIVKKKASQSHKPNVPKKLQPECPVSDDFWTEAARTVLELAKPIDRQVDTSQTIFNSKLIEEYVIETRDETGLKFMIKLTISQRNSDYEYIGEIQQSRELSTGGFHDISYSFPLGTQEMATRYVLEFTNVYTERGKIHVNMTHKVPGKPPDVFLTAGLRMEGNKLVPIESKSLELDTLVSWQMFSDSRSENKSKNVSNTKIQRSEKIILPQHVNHTNTVKQITLSSDSLTSNQLQIMRDQQHLQMQIQHQLQQQITQHKRQQQTQQLQQEIKAIANFKAQIQEHLQMRQANAAPQYTPLLNKKDALTLNTSQNVIAQRNVTTLVPKTVNTTVQYQAANSDISLPESINVSTCSNTVSTLGSNNSTILSLLAGTSAQSSSTPSATSISLGNLLTSSSSIRNINASHTVTVAGQHVMAKRVKMQNATRVINAANTQPVVTSIAIAAATTNVPNVTTINSQPVIRLSLSSLSNQTTPVIQQRGGKSIAGRIITPGNLKTASLVNSIQPVNVTSGNIQLSNNIQNISLLNNTNAQTAAGIRVKSNHRRNISVGGLQSITVNASNGQTVNETQTINCAKIQNVGTSTGLQLSAGELQTLAGTLTAAPTIGTIQLTRNVQTLPAASVHLVSNNSQTINSVNKNTTLNSIQLNSSNENIVSAKMPKIMRLSSSQDNSVNTSIGLPVSTLSALLSGTSVADNSASGIGKSGMSLMERIAASSSTTSTSQNSSIVNTNATLNLANTTNTGVGVQNVQLSIPGMAVPITLSLNVGVPNNTYLDALSQNTHSVTSLPNVVGTSVILANSNAGNSIKTSSLRPVTNAATVANIQSGTVQQLQLISSVPRNKLGAQMPKQMTARGLLNANRVQLTVPPNAVVQQQPGGQNQVLSVTAQQQLQVALQKQAAQFQLHQGLTAAGGLKVAQKRRRSSVATEGS